MLCRWRQPPGLASSTNPRPEADTKDAEVCRPPGLWRQVVRVRWLTPQAVRVSASGLGSQSCSSRALVFRG